MYPLSFMYVTYNFCLLAVIVETFFLQLKLVNPSAYRFEHLVTQMKWRLEEGQGEAIYEIGVEDNGLLVGLSNADLMASVHTLERMAEKYVLLEYFQILFVSEH